VRNILYHGQRQPLFNPPFFKTKVPKMKPFISKGLLSRTRDKSKNFSLCSTGKYYLSKPHKGSLQYSASQQGRIRRGREVRSSVIYCSKPNTLTQLVHDRQRVVWIELHSTWWNVLRSELKDGMPPNHYGEFQDQFHFHTLLHIAIFRHSGWSKFLIHHCSQLQLDPAWVNQEWL